MTNEVIFEIYFRKIEGIKFPEYCAMIFDRFRNIYIFSFGKQWCYVFTLSLVQAVSIFGLLRLFIFCIRCLDWRCLPITNVNRDSWSFCFCTLPHVCRITERLLVFSIDKNVLNFRISNRIVNRNQYWRLRKKCKNSMTISKEIERK